MKYPNFASYRALIAIFILVGVLVIHAWSLLRYPAAFTDEGWYANRTWAFLSTGRAFGTADAGALENYTGYWTYYQWLPTWFRSLSMRFFTTPDLLSVRIVSLFFGLALLGAVYAIGKALGGRGMGIVAALLVSVSTAFLYSAHIARDDVIAAAFGYLALAFYLANRRHRQATLGFASGLCLGLAFEIHPHSAIFAPAIGVLFLADEGRRVLRSRPFWGFVLGGGLAGLFFIERHLLRFPGTFAAISALFFLDTHTPPVLTFHLPVILQGFLETGLLLFNHYLVLIPAVLWAAGASLWPKQPVDGRGAAGLLTTRRTLLIVILALLAGLALLVRNKFRHYAILVTPAIDLLLAGYLLDFARRPWQGEVRDYANRVAWGLLAVAVALNFSVLYPNPQAPYARVEARLQAAVRPGERVVGPETYWFALYEHDFADWIQLVIYQRYDPGSSLEEAFSALHPDIFILDENMGIFVADQAGDTPFLQHFQLVKTELDQFLSTYASQVDSISEPGWPAVQVYRLHWDKLALDEREDFNVSERPRP